MSDLDVIKEIEKTIGKELKPFHNNEIFMSLNASGSYFLNDEQQITGLNLQHFKLEHIDFIKPLKNISRLHLGANQIRDITPLKELKNLIELNLGGNKIVDISVIRELVNLSYLNLSSNQVIDISAVINLENIIQLHLDRNNLVDISPLKELKSLTMLCLSGNNIHDITPIKFIKSLDRLNLNDNNISDISVIRELNKIILITLWRNNITELPEWILDFNLDISLERNVHIDVDKGIYIYNNPIEQPPIEIIKQGNEAIHAYFEQIRKEGTDTLYEAKLILVGEGGAGKTSLANKIINPDWQLIPEIKSESTKGIDILSYQFPYKEKTFRVNIWDFGGQEIYHQTHQFFLSKRALYFLLTDDRKEDTDFYHWLNIVDLLSANSPVLIIKNEKSNRSRDIPEQELKEFNNIKDTLATDLSNNRGLPEIVKALQYYITDLPHIRTPIPKTWTKVRKQLEQDSRYYIDLKEYFAICEDNGIKEENYKLQLSGEYLHHQVGVCLHFQNDTTSPLYKTLILKPTWATDAVYKVLDNDTVKNQAGHFNNKDLADIWQAEEYNTMRGELLALMQKFKLCYEIRNQPQHYIAPQLLKDKAPQYDWQTNDNLLLRYQYDFMPKGILSQFIVEMHEYIAHNYEWVWKSGVVLEKDKTQAEIIEYYGKREIHIRVQGNNKKELLNIISYELDKINGSYERLKDKCKKLIPCNCEQCKESQKPHFYDYQKLKERIAHRKYTIECGNPPYTDVNVLKLIEDIDLKLERDTIDYKQNQHIEVHVHANQENDMSTDNSRHQSFNGTATNSNLNLGDNSTQTNSVNNQGMSKEEFLQLLQTFKQDLSKSGLPADTVEIVTDDIATVEKQLQKTEPDKSIVSRKLESINGLLEDTSKTLDTATKGYETLNKILETGKTLLSALSFLV